MTVLVDCGDFRVREAVLADGVDDYLWRHDPETAKLVGLEAEGQSLSDFLEGFRADLEMPLRGRRWLALDDEEGRHFGTMVVSLPGLYTTTAEIGITIGPAEYRGRGVGRRAVVALLRNLWQTTALRRVELHTLEWNERAHRCFLRAGFTDVARLVRGGQPLIRMEARREWWLMWDGEGRFGPP